MSLFPWRRIDPLKGVAPDKLHDATAAAAEHPEPPLPALPYTEANPTWVLLYDHARQGQIRPEKVKRMRTVDLEFIAGTAQPHPAMFETPEGRDQATKLLGNVARATRELQRRHNLWQGGIVVVAGAFIAAAATIVTRFW